ncbi:MAG: hypothetical protein HZB14_07200 [Actinobacteria bacterium]|nr:hypothetical protein [Actinomycetota bacterium]
MTEHNDQQAPESGGSDENAPATHPATPLDSPTAAHPEASPADDGFNPLVNEADMFKVLVGVVILVAVVIALVLLGRAVL